MTDQFTLFDFFNGGTTSMPFGDEESKKPEKKKSKAKEELNEEVETEEMDAVETEDEEDLEEELVVETKETSSKSNSKKDASSKGKKGKNITGETKVSLPVTCKGRNWSYTIDGFGTKTINEVLADLYAAGIVEVSHKDVNPIADEKSLKNQTLYFTSPTKESKSSLSVFSFKKDMIVADGMEQMPLTPEMFSGMDLEEISVFHVQELWEKGFSVYENLGLNFCSSSNVAIPVIAKSLGVNDTTKLPADIVISGEKTPIKIGLFDPMEVTVSDITKEYFPGLNVTIKCIKDTLYCEYTGKVVTGLKKPGLINGAKEVVAKELITLPCQCYFVTLNQTFELSSEMFGGKNKITSGEIIELLRKTYALLRNKDRHIEVVYAREQSLVSVALTSGTKGSGSAYALPEASECGLFKMIRTFEELQEVKKLKNFLGVYVPTLGPSQRIEVCPHAIYTATMGEGRELTRIKNISYELKRPKIPYRLFQAIVEDFKAYPESERIVQICWNEEKEEYYLSFPSYEESGKSFIHYHFKAVPPIVTIHSHNTMPAYFSQIDNRDEAITGVYGVIGTVHQNPTFKFRVGMEGSFQELELFDLFEEV